MIRKARSISIVLVTPYALSLGASAVETPKLPEGHRPILSGTGTTPELSATLSDPELGTHKITVMLVDNDHQPLGPRETLIVNIPPANGDRAQP